MKTLALIATLAVSTPALAADPATVPFATYKSAVSALVEQRDRSENEVVDLKVAIDALNATIKDLKANSAVAP